MQQYRKSLARFILMLFAAAVFAPVACEKKTCPDVVDRRPQAKIALYNRCVFGVDAFGEPVGQYELLYPRCDFYVNTEPSLTVKSGFEGQITARKFNPRLNETVFNIQIREASLKDQEGWVSRKKAVTLVDIYAGRAENAQEGKVPAVLTVTSLDRLSYRFDLVFTNTDVGVREIFFNPLNNTATRSPSFEVRSVATGDLLRLSLELEPVSGDDWGYVSGTYLYRKIWPGSEWRLRFRVRLDETAEKEFGAVANYSTRKELDPGMYFTCASPLVLF